MGEGPGGTAGRRLVALAAAGAFFLGGFPGASASTYNDSDGHYSFEYPASWAERSSPGADVAVLGPSQGGFGPNIVSQHAAEPAAQNSQAWLIHYVQASLEALKAQLNLTEIAGPRTFVAGSGRLAGDYVIEREESGLALRQRQVYFVSAYYGFTFVLTFTDKASTYNDHQANWIFAVDSFAVEGERGVQGGVPGAVDESPVGTFLVLAGGATLVASLFFLVTVERRRGRPKEAALARPAPAGGARGELAGAPGAEVAATSGDWLPVPLGRPETLEPLSPEVAATPTRRAGRMPEGEAPPMSLGSAPTPGPRGPVEGSSTVRCPRCRAAFRAPARRPLAVVCPSCGARGTLR